MKKNVYYEKWDNVLRNRFYTTLRNLHKDFPKGYCNFNGLTAKGYSNICTMRREGLFTGRFTRDGVEYWYINPMTV